MNELDQNRAAVRLAERVSQWTAAPILGSAVAARLLGQGWPLAWTGAASLLLLLASLARRARPRSYLPTVVTCIRALLTCLLIARGHELAGAHVALTILTVFTLDGLDGFLARRMHSVSVLGERLDMETDALLMLTTCMLLSLQGRVGLWVLTGGLLRYAYVLVVWRFAAHGEVPRSRLARYSFGISLSSLTLGFLTPGPLAPVGPALATAVLSYSFGRSFYWSFRNASVRISQSNKTSEPSEK